MINSSNLEKSLKALIHESWHQYLLPYLTSNEGINIFDEIKACKKKGIEVFPSSKDCFNAFKLPFNEVKVVILGQDPYYTKGVATGYAFGVRTSKPQPSLYNIIKEIKRTEGKQLTDFTLASWVDQGVLLLNTALTVEKNNPNSHKKIWKRFINFVFSVLNQRDDIIYLLWGGNAKAYTKLITKGTILESPHPSPLAKGFVGNDHFRRTNEILIKNGKQPIEWTRNSTI